MKRPEWNPDTEGFEWRRAEPDLTAITIVALLIGIAGAWVAVIWNLLF